jgi:hypothetical protein
VILVRFAKGIRRGFGVAVLLLTACGLGDDPKPQAAQQPGTAASELAYRCRHEPSFTTTSFPDLLLQIRDEGRTAVVDSTTFLERVHVLDGYVRYSGRLGTSGTQLDAQEALSRGTRRGSLLIGASLYTCEAP